MEKYTVQELTIKRSGTTSAGKPYTISSVKFEGNEETYDTFDTLTVGETYEGEIKANENPKYPPSFKVKKPAKGNSFFASKTKDMEKVMDKKQEGIKMSQEAKFDGIKCAGSITNATNLLVAMLESKIVATGAGLLNGSDVHQLLENEIKYFEGLYDKENPPF